MVRVHDDVMVLHDDVMVLHDDVMVLHDDLYDQKKKKNHYLDVDDPLVLQHYLLDNDHLEHVKV